MPFHLRHRHHTDLAAAERRRIAVPLVRVQERLATLGSDLDTLADDVSKVALRMRQMADRVTSQTGGNDDD